MKYTTDHWNCARNQNVYTRARLKIIDVGRAQDWLRPNENIKKKNRKIFIDHTSWSTDCPFWRNGSRENHCSPARTPSNALASTCALHVVRSSFPSPLSIFLSLFVSLFLPLFFSSPITESNEGAKQRSKPPSEILPPLSSISRSAAVAMAGGSPGYQTEGWPREGTGHWCGVSLWRLFSSHSSASRPPLVAPRSRYHRPPKKVDWPWK